MDSSYIISLIPLLLGHLVIPPLSLLDGSDRLSNYDVVFANFVAEIYRLVPNKFLSYKYVNSLCCDMKEIAKYNVLDISRIWNSTLVTYMFVHADFNHVFGNMLGLIASSKPVYDELGQFGLYSLFLVGGIGAILPSPIHNKQTLMNMLLIDDYIADSIPSFITDMLPTSISKYVHNATARISNAIIDYLPRKACGSSGAVSAFIGFSIPCDCRDIYNLYKNKYRLDSKVRARKLLQIIFKVIYTSSYLLTEFGLVSLDRESRLEVSKSSSNGLFSMIFVSHSGHVQGGLIGLMLGLLKIFIL